MKTFNYVTILLLLLLFMAGCEPNIGVRKQEADPLTVLNYSPDKAGFVGLTGVTYSEKLSQDVIVAFVDLRDKFDSRIKFPGKFRFELYNSANNQSTMVGKRVKIWDDFDLNDPAVNNAKWMDNFRAYRFELPCGNLERNKPYLLDVTFMGPDQRRLQDRFIIKKG